MIVYKIFIMEPDFFKKLQLYRNFIENSKNHKFF